MKFSPTLTLALALAAGMAGAAAAQTTTTSPTTSTTNSSYPQSSYTQPQSSAVQRQPNYGQTTSGQTSPGTMPQGYAQPNANRQATAAGASPQVMAAQQRLKALGLYSGPADGIMDPDTRAALANFQRQHELRDTEGLNQQTMSALTSAQPTATGSSTNPSNATPPTGVLNNAPAPMAAGGNSATSPTRPRTTTSGQSPAR